MDRLDRSQHDDCFLLFYESIEKLKGYDDLCPNKACTFLGVMLMVFDVQIIAPFSGSLCALCFLFLSNGSIFDFIQKMKSKKKTKGILLNF